MEILQPETTAEVLLTVEILQPKTTAKVLLTTVGTLSKWRLRGCGPPYVTLGPRNIGYPKDELEKWLRANIRTSTSGGGKGGRKPRMQELAK